MGEERREINVESIARRMPPPRKSGSDLDMLDDFNLASNVGCYDWQLYVESFFFRRLRCIKVLLSDGLLKTCHRTIRGIVSSLRDQLVASSTCELD